MLLLLKPLSLVWTVTLVCSTSGVIVDDEICQFGQKTLYDAGCDIVHQGFVIDGASER